jgi:hypothetical protein
MSGSKPLKTPAQRAAAATAAGTGTAHPGSGSGRGAAPTAPGKTGVTHNGQPGRSSAAGTNPGKGPGNKPPKNPPKQGNGNFGLGKAGVNTTVNANKGANAAANAEFGTQINDTRTAQADAVAQAHQNLRDITDWYSQLAKQNMAGGVTDQQATEAAAGQVHNTIQDLIASIGGQANSGSGSLAQGGVDALANLLGQGVTQQNFITNRGVADTAAQAGQMSAQQALDSQKQQGLASQLMDLLNQKAAAVITNRQQLIAQNNAARQANFGNQISRLDAILGARQAVGNQKVQGLQIAQGKQALKTAKATAAQAKGPGGGPLFVNMTTAQRVAAVSAMMGGNPSSTPYAVAVKRGQAMGFSVKQFGPLLQSYYTN